MKGSAIGRIAVAFTTARSALFYGGGKFRVSD